MDSGTVSHGPVGISAAVTVRSHGLADGPAGHSLHSRGKGTPRSRPTAASLTARWWIDSNG